MQRFVFLFLPLPLSLLASFHARPSKRQKPFDFLPKYFTKEEDKNSSHLVARVYWWPSVIKTMSQYFKRIPLFHGQNHNHKSLEFQVGGNQKGEVTLMLILFLMGLGLFMALSLKKLSLSHSERKQRQQTYLCLKTTMDSFSSHLTFIKRTNMLILSMNALILANPTPYLLKAKRMIQALQNKKNLYTALKAIKNKYCKGIQKLFIKKSFPLKGKFLSVHRSILGTAIIKSKPTQFILPSRHTPPFMFLIKGKLSFSPRYQISKSKEIPLTLYRWQ